MQVFLLFFFFLKARISVVFWACDGKLWKIMPISSIWKQDFRCFFVFGLWWEHLENNANIFSLNTEFPWFFLACDGNLWKIMPISSIWKRNFRGFLGLWWEPLENNANIFYLKTGLKRPEVLLHSPLRGVTRVWASMFYCFYISALQQSQKMTVGQKIFK